LDRWQDLSETAAPNRLICCRWWDSNYYSRLSER